VLRYETPLSSDALTGWGAKDPNKHIHNQEVLDATKHLLLKVIPEFVANHSKWSSLVGKEIINAMHNRGSLLSVAFSLSRSDLSAKVSMLGILV